MLKSQVIIVLQESKVKLREVKLLAKSHTANREAGSVT